MDVSMEVRSVIECVLADRIEPAIRDLAAASSSRPQGKEGACSMNEHGGGAMSSYLLILRRNQAEPLSLPQEEMFTRFKQFTPSLRERGALRAVERLKPSAEGTTARSRNGTVAIEGPYDGSTEGVIGFFLVEAADQEAAHTMAKECPILLVGGSVEIRETELFPRS
jgi:hypothetical protein